MISIPAITADQMREVDRLMIEVYGIPLRQMMERAGGHLADLARTMLGGEVAEQRVFVAAGRGNNGGGGLVAARHLSNWGGRVTVAIEREASLTGAPAGHWRRLTHLPMDRKSGDDAVHALQARPDLVIDALIGYGLRGSPRGWTAEMIMTINESNTPVLALDVPSGLDATTGIPGDPCVRARATMTLALPKTGLLVPRARPYVGDLYLADISVPPSLYRRLGLDVGPVFAVGGLIRL
ncbi:MAG: NAD(P)H-hydrate epimerase [Armatimonadetes bacterium]|nr:NAD(P)H-hydrate epimerase [Armatimonadota bacterium]